MAGQLPYAEPDDRAQADKDEKEALQARIGELELEIKVLKEAISLMRG